MIRNVLFDFGGVFVRLTKEICVSRFKKIGIHDADDLLDPYHQQGLFLRLEEGALDEDAFTSAINTTYGISVTPEEIKHALLGFVGNIQQEKFRYLKEDWPKGVRRFLVSNINPFIWSYARSGTMIDDGCSIDDYFDAIFTSYECKICKPNKSLFELIIRKTGIRPEETLFIDDGQANVAMARTLGFVTYCPDNGEDWRPIIDKMLK